MDAPNSGDTVVEVRELRYTINGRAIFDGLNLTVRRGEITQMPGSGIVVIATGSSYAHPFKASGDVSAFRSATFDAHERLRAARSVAIVGAGAVGTELAGEIAAGMPMKTITLISSTPTLFPDFPPALGQRLQVDLGGTATISQVVLQWETASAKAIEAKHAQWTKQLPEAPADLWDALTGFDGDSRAALFAHCASLTVNVQLAGAPIEFWALDPVALIRLDRPLLEEMSHL